MEAKRRCDELEGSLKIVETTVNAILQDVHTLREGNYVKGESLHKRSLTLYQRWVTLRKRMQVRYDNERWQVRDSSAILVFSVLPRPIFSLIRRAF